MMVIDSAEYRTRDLNTTGVSYYTTVPPLILEALEKSLARKLIQERMFPYSLSIHIISGCQ